VRILCSLFFKATLLLFIFQNRQVKAKQNLTSNSKPTASSMQSFDKVLGLAFQSWFVVQS
ncbi:MAG: hypothetical protein M1480_17495, partial [Bacteroidetes bacterium]|nr:hypothetical protein [Bacteroidota bacterium]